MCLHLYSTVCPVVCDHLRIDVSPRARAIAGPRLKDPDVTLGACGCPVLPGRAAELVRIAHVYENLVPAFANKISSKQRLALSLSLPGPAGARGGGRRERDADGVRERARGMWPSVFSSHVSSPRP